jgi:uncharacterized protein YjaG (DUF416 family)
MTLSAVQSLAALEKAVQIQDLSIANILTAQKKTVEVDSSSLNSKSAIVDSFLAKKEIIRVVEDCISQRRFEDDFALNLGIINPDFQLWYFS